MKALIHASIAACLFLAATLPSSAMIDVGDLSKEEAKKLGITMKSRPNGDAGILVWVEFKKVDFLEHFTYAEFQLNDVQGKHLASATQRWNVAWISNDEFKLTSSDIGDVSWKRQPDGGWKKQ